MTTEKKEKIIETIRKLMKTASGNANENESAVALNKARAMMMKYSLESADLKEKQNIIEYKVVGRFYASTWRKILISIINRHYQCKAYVSTLDHETYRNTGKKRQAVYFIGRDYQAEVAGYAFEMINKQVWLMEDRKYRELKNEGYGSGVKALVNGYVHGILGAINEKLEEQRGYQTAEETALVKVMDAEVQEYFNKLSLVRGKATRRENSNALYGQGRTDGRNVNLNPGINSGGSKQLQIGG